VKEHEGKTAEETKKAEYKKEFNQFMRKGTEMKAMSVNSDEDGGYLVTPEMSSEIVTKVFESSPMRAIASVQVISSDALEMMEDLELIQSGWVGETQPRGNTDTAKLKMIKIPTHELFAQPLATQKLLDDAAVNVESWLAGKASQKFALDEATAFVSGNGVGKPKGFLAYDAGSGFNQVEQQESAGSGVIVGDDLIDVQALLKEPYQKGAVWMAQRQTIKVFRKLKDSQGRYLWEPGLNGAQQPTLLGAPVYQANDMAAYANGALAVAYGDFKAGYQIVDRIGIRVIRDVYTNKPFVLFYTTKRVGGAVKNFEAIKILKVKA
jgi:HK97 family phage major capsid protein